MSDNIFADLVLLEKFAGKIHRSWRTVHRWTTLPGGLPYVKVGRERYIHLPTAREWIMSRMRRPNPDRRRRRRNHIEQPAPLVRR
jgi:Family of unknown function (DUF6074)